ncbi:MAG: protein HflC [Alphaproteobacteria bacterium]|jgi:membrane protease subunit HflC|nr:protein HflC [Alphaproteobacteria bacterium]
MRNPVTTALLIIVGVLVLIAYSSFYIVDPRQQAIVRQFGEIKRVETTPGLKFKIPLMQDVVYFDRRVLEFDVPKESFILSDQKRLEVDAYARVRIIDPLRFFQSVQNETGLRNRLGPVIQSAIRRALGEATLQQVLSAQRVTLMQEITASVDKEGRSFGVEVLDVRLKRGDLPVENSEAVYRRMQTQREQEARQIRAEGGEESQRIRANADREVIVVQSEARKQAEVARGEGDGQAIKIYADAFGRDPKFFAFYRSMEAYRQALGRNDTTMVLSPENSEFFRFFGTQDNGQPGAPSRR